MAFTLFLTMDRRVVARFLKESSWRALVGSFVDPHWISGPATYGVKSQRSSPAAVAGSLAPLHRQQPAQPKCAEPPAQTVGHAPGTVLHQPSTVREPGRMKYLKKIPARSSTIGEAASRGSRPRTGGAILGSGGAPPLPPAARIRSQVPHELGVLCLSPLNGSCRTHTPFHVSLYPPRAARGSVPYAVRGGRPTLLAAPRRRPPRARLPAAGLETFGARRMPVRHHLKATIRRRSYLRRPAQVPTASIAQSRLPRRRQSFAGQVCTQLTLLTPQHGGELADLSRSTR